MYRVTIVAAASNEARVFHWHEKADRTTLVGAGGERLVKHEGIDVYSPEQGWFETKAEAVADATRKLWYLIDECNRAISYLNSEA